MARVLVQYPASHFNRWLDRYERIRQGDAPSPVADAKFLERICDMHARGVPPAAAYARIRQLELLLDTSKVVH